MNENENELFELMFELHKLKHGEEDILLPKPLLKFTGFIECFDPANWKYKKVFRKDLTKRKVTK